MIQQPIKTKGAPTNAKIISVISNITAKVQKIIYNEMVEPLCALVVCKLLGVRVMDHGLALSSVMLSLRTGFVGKIQVLDLVRNNLSILKINQYGNEAIIIVKKL